MDRSNTAKGDGRGQLRGLPRQLWGLPRSSTGAERSIWRTIVHHVVGRHSWVLDDGFGIFECGHGPTEEDPVRPYLQADSPAHQALCAFVFNKTYFKSVAQHYTNFRHTGHLDVFHHHLLMYCSKRFAFRHPAYKARNLLAAIDFNQHKDREIKKDINGEPMYGRTFNKRSGCWSAVLLKENKEYNYIPQLQEEILETRLALTRPLQAKRELEADDGRRISRTCAPHSPPSTAQLALDKISRNPKWIMLTKQSEATG